jgi:hypothetical protein
MARPCKLRLSGARQRNKPHHGKTEYNMAFNELRNPSLNVYNTPMFRYPLPGLLKFLVGITLVQAATAAIVAAGLRTQDQQIWLLLSGLALTLSCLAAFWFVSIVNHAKKDAIVNLKDSFAREREKIRNKAEKHKEAMSREREKIRLLAEREKTKIVKDTHEQLIKERVRSNSSANFKVGASFAGLIGIGAMMLFTQFITLGLLTLTTAGGALAGYTYRLRQDREKRKESQPLEAPRQGEKLIGSGASKNALTSARPVRKRGKPDALDFIDKE